MCITVFRLEPAIVFGFLNLIRTNNTSHNLHQDSLIGKRDTNLYYSSKRIRIVGNWINAAMELSYDHMFKFYKLRPITIINKNIDVYNSANGILVC